jgi:hypothetical protein
LPRVAAFGGGIELLTFSQNGACLPGMTLRRHHDGVHSHYGLHVRGITQ